MMMRADVVPAPPVPAAAPLSLRPARPVLRLIAYLVDWLVTLIIASVLVSIAGLQLYLFADRGREEAPDTAVYAFLAISSLIVPIWLLMTLVGWSRGGRSIGKLALGLKIVDRQGRRPGVPRSVVRVIVYALENVPLLLAAAVVGLRLAGAGAVSGWLLTLAVVLLLAGLAALAPALPSLGGRPLHDRAAGTVVVEE